VMETAPSHPYTHIGFLESNMSNVAFQNWIDITITVVAVIVTILRLPFGNKIANAIDRLWANPAGSACPWLIQTLVLRTRDFDAGTIDTHG
jgi:hypothetical protein